MEFTEAESNMNDCQCTLHTRLARARIETAGHHRSLCLFSLRLCSLSLCPVVSEYQQYQDATAEDEEFEDEEEDADAEAEEA